MMALKMPPKIPGIPCKLLVPHVSYRLTFLSRRGVRNLKQRVEMMPTTNPMARATGGRQLILAADPIATPPDSVAFSISSMDILLPSIEVSTNVPTQLPDSAQMVLVEMTSSSQQLVAPLHSKLGQYIHRMRVPSIENTISVRAVLALRQDATFLLRIQLTARPKQVPKACTVTDPPTSQVHILYLTMVSLRVQKMDSKTAMRRRSLGPTLPITLANEMSMTRMQPMALERSMVWMPTNFYTGSLVNAWKITLDQKLVSSMYSWNTIALMRKVQVSADREWFFMKVIANPTPSTIITQLCCIRVSRCCSRASGNTLGYMRMNSPQQTSRMACRERRARLKILRFFCSTVPSPLRKPQILLITITSKFYWVDCFIVKKSKIISNTHEPQYLGNTRPQLNYYCSDPSLPYDQNSYISQISLWECTNSCGRQFVLTIRHTNKTLLQFNSYHHSSNLHINCPFHTTNIPQISQITPCTQLTSFSPTLLLPHASYPSQSKSSPFLIHLQSQTWHGHWLCPGALNVPISFLNLDVSFLFVCFELTEVTMPVISQNSLIEVERTVLDNQAGVVAPVVGVMPGGFSVIAIICNKTAVRAHQHPHYVLYQSLQSNPLTIQYICGQYILLYQS